MRTFVEFKKNLKDFLYLLSFKKKFCLRTSVVLIKKKKKKVIPCFKYTGIRNFNIRKRII